MNDLPLVPTLKIFNYLSINDILNLKLVNKWFYQFINGNVRIKDLVLSNGDSVPYNTIWFYTYDLINLQNLVKYNLYDDCLDNTDSDNTDPDNTDSDNNVYLLNLNLNQPILGQLKQLYISGTEITLKTLNSLDQLVHLEIFYSYIYDTTDNNVLSLPLLEILNFDSPEDNQYLIIDSTKLQRLRLYERNVRIVHPESITYLEFYHCYEYKNLLSSCINLQHLYCHSIRPYDLKEFNFIKNLSKLKSIHLNATREAFASLAKEKKCFNKDLKIYFRSLEFDEPDELPDGLRDGPDNRDYSETRAFLDENLIPYYVEYYSRLADHCPFVNIVNYNHLERYFNQIPENFMKRFVDLKEFIVTRDVDNLDQLIRVLGECKTIRNLELHSSLGQHFFDSHLYDLCPYIRTLDIIGEEVLNCEFILKFKNSKRFTVYQTESIEFATRLDESHGDLRVEFGYFHNQDLFKIIIYKHRNHSNHGITIRKGEESLALDSIDWPKVRRFIGLPLTEV